MPLCVLEIGTLEVVAQNITPHKIKKKEPRANIKIISRVDYTKINIRNRRIYDK